MRFDEVVARLDAVRWGSAPDWDPRALAWLRAYYARLAPWWPAERARLPPTDRVIEEAAYAGCDRDRVTAACEALWSARRERVEPATKTLVGFALAWACTLDAARDPGVPLVELFAAGFQIAYTDAGIELHYASGWQIAPVPSRELGQ